MASAASTDAVSVGEAAKMMSAAPADALLDGKVVLASLRTMHCGKWRWDEWQLFYAQLCCVLDLSWTCLVSVSVPIFVPDLFRTCAVLSLTPPSGGGADGQCRIH